MSGQGDDYLAPYRGIEFQLAPGPAPEFIEIRQAGWAKADPDPSFRTIHEMLMEKVQAVAISNVKAWERATLEAAFEAGLDIRTPFGEDVIAFARMTWACWMEPTLDGLVPRVRL